MKKFFFLALVGALPLAANAQFAEGNLVAIRVGDGSTIVDSETATGFSIDQFTTSGSLVTSTAITGMTHVVGSPSFANGSLSSVYFGGGGPGVANFGVSFGGFGDAPGTSGTGSTATPRKVGYLRFDSATGTQYSTSLTGGSLATNGNLNSVWSNGNMFFAGGNSGASGGLFRTTLAGVSTLVSSTITNLGTIQGAGSDAYFSSGASVSAAHGLYKVTNAASGTGIVAKQILAIPGLYPDDFEMFRDGAGTPTAVLVAELTDPTLGGLYFASGWNPTLNGGDGGFTGAATRIVTSGEIKSALGATDTIYGIEHLVIRGTDVYGVTRQSTTTNNRIVKISFANGFSSPNTGISLVATAGTNRIFQGIEIVPEPATFIAISIGIVALAARRRLKK